MDIFKELKKEPVFRKLVDFGLFSEKLAAIFTSENFGQWIRKNGVSTYKKKAFSTVRFHLIRNNNAPRIIDIPHPISYFRLCKEIRSNWSEIISRLGEVEDYTDRSMVTPKPNNMNKRLVSMLSYNMRKDEKLLILDKSFKAKYFVHADIANCYPSIYSHSVPWALVGHQEAKDNMNDETKWYNKLDTAIRSMQRNETVGIAIGPDTSLLICDLILSRVDKELNEYKYLRFIDDFKCYCSSKEEADNFIISLCKELEKCHLRLNTRKTKIIALPKALDQNWVRELKTYNNKFLGRRSKKLSRFNINTVSEFMDLALTLAESHPDDSPIRYAVRILANKKYIDDDIYAFTIMYLSRICFIYPYFTDVFDEILSNNKPSKGIKSLVSKEINSIVKEHLKYSRSDVALWGIHIAMKHKFKIRSFEKYSDELLSSRDCLPSLLCYYYAKQNKLSTDKYFELIPNLIKEKIEEEWWIYVYQLFIESPTKVVFRPIQFKDFYDEMRKAGVTFLKGKAA